MALPASARDGKRTDSYSNVELGPPDFGHGSDPRVLIRMCSSLAVKFGGALKNIDKYLLQSAGSAFTLWHAAFV